MKDNKIKIKLTAYSFLPLFLLLFFKYFELRHFGLYKKFAVGILHGEFSVIVRALGHEQIWHVLIVLFSGVWIVYSVLVIAVFKDSQTWAFISTGDRITDVHYSTDQGLSFFASYLIPLITDIDQKQDFLAFIGIFIMLYLLVYQSRLFYQNPILVIMGYRTFAFRCSTMSEDVCIGITRGAVLDTMKPIKYKQISDKIYFIYNEVDFTKEKER